MVMVSGVHTMAECAGLQVEKYSSFDVILFMVIVLR